MFSSDQRFMPNAFEDFSSLCQKEGKVAKFLDIEKPAVYVRSADIVDQISSIIHLIVRLDTMAKPALRKISTNNTFNCEIEIQTVRAPSY